MNGGSVSLRQQWAPSVWLLELVMLLQTLELGSSLKPAGMILGAIGNLARHEPGELPEGDQS